MNEVRAPVVSTPLEQENGDARSQRSSIGDRFMRKLAPYLALLYFFLFLDRQNINFAGLQMNGELELSATAFGLAIGLFSVGYCIFELPSTLILRKVGARRWLARIMVSWGLLSAATAFVHNSYSLYTLRFLLGAAEAGFVPGVIYFLTNWLPTSERGRVIGVFMIAVPMASVIGAPFSGVLLGLNWLGLHGWQWLFLLEGLPAAMLGVSILRFLPDGPDEVPWLTSSEKSWLRTELNLEKARVAAVGCSTIRSVLTSPMVLLLGLIYLGNGVGLFGISAWLPLLTRNLGFGYTQTGLVISCIYLIMAVVIVLWTRHADRHGEYLWHVAIPSLMGVTFILLGGFCRSPALAVAFLASANILMSPVTPTFWSLPPHYLSGGGAAAGIALISAIGSLGAFIGPTMVGMIKDRSGDFSTAVLFLTAGPLMAAALTLSLRWHRAFARH
jgi:ACS family tartrate transporter-like MFS transporter